jgi:HK97 family phage major capsid protein
MPFLTEEEKSRIEQAEEKAGIAGQLVELKKALDARDEEIKSTLQKMAEDLKTKGDKADYDQYVKKLDELGAKAQEVATQMLALEQKLARPAGGAFHQAKSLGQQVIEDEAVKAMMGGKSARATVNLKSFEFKAAGPITSATTSAGVLVEPQRLGLISPPDQPLLVRGLLMPGTTTSNALEYPREKLFTNGAAPQTAELAMKAQSDITFEMVSTTVKTIAHFMYASKQIMDDAPQLASYINGRLIYGLKYVEEQQLLLGDGTGQNLLGIIPQATAYDEDLEALLEIQNRNKMDVLRVAMLQVQLALYPPSGIVLHPTDWAAITLVKDANGNYLIANPQSTVSQMLWSLPVVPSMSMPQGQFLVGAFQLGAQLFDREQANIAISYEDRDNFVKNAVTIRAEERLALAVYRPQAFVTGEFPEPDAGGDGSGGGGA